MSKYGHFIYQDIWLLYMFWLKLGCLRNRCAMEFCFYFTSALTRSTFCKPSFAILLSKFKKISDFLEYFIPSPNFSSLLVKNGSMHGVHMHITGKLEHSTFQNLQPYLKFFTKNTDILTHSLPLT